MSRFGVLELTVPRRARPAVEILADESGAPSALTWALALIRAIEREAAADGGARLLAMASAEVAGAAAAPLAILSERIGERVTLTADPGRRRGDFAVTRQ